MSGIDWSALASALGFGNDQTQQQQPPQPDPYLLGGSPAFGVPQVSRQRPQLATPEEFQKNQNSLGAIIGSFANGTIPGLSRIFGGDPNATNAAYNAMLQQAQQAESGRLGLPQAEFKSGVYTDAVNDLNGKAGQGQQAAPGVPQDQAAPAQQPLPQASDGMSWGGAAASFMPPVPQAPQAPSFSGAAPSQGGAPQSTGGLGGTAPFGMALPLGMTGNNALRNQLLFPKEYDEATKAFYADHRGGSTYRDPMSGQTRMAPQGLPGVPGVPGQPDYNQGVTQFEGAKAQGGVGPAIQVMSATQRAEQAKAEALARQKYTFETGQPAPGALTDPAAAPRTTGGPLSADGPAPLPGSAPPSSAAQATTSLGNAALKGEDFQTDRGTVVPSVKDQTIQQGTIDYKNQADASQKTQENWNAVRGQIDTTRSRVLSTAQVLTQTQAGGLNEVKANASKILSGMGMEGLAKQVMSAKDRAGVQTILWNSMQESLAYLKTANAGTGGRILNSEFNAFLEHGYSPDMEPAALREGMKQLLGGAYQTGNMIDDWNGPARKLNWRDANQFQSSYLRKNPLDGFIKYANQELPTFKGMEPGPKPGQGTPYTRAEIDAEIARRAAAKPGSQ